MRFEDLDKRIKEAAEQHHPAYDEKAWQKMERLLNQHLPKSKNDRRRVFLFLLAFLVIGGGTFIVISKPWQNESHVAVQSQNVNEPVKSTSKQKQDNPTSTKQNDSRETGNNQVGQTKVLDQRLPVQTVTSASKKTPKTASATEDQPATSDNRPPNAGNVNKPDQLPPALDKEKTSGNAKDVVAKSDATLGDPPQADKQNVSKAQDEQVNHQQNSEIAKADKKSTRPKGMEKPINRNGFSFSVSAGPDVSKAGGSKAGEVTLAYGAGVAYTKNRFTLRTGVYGSKKIYWADPDDYTLSYIPPPTTQFEGADADCYVIEVPVKLSYNFALGPKSNWFAGAGLSSYFMKRETYNYLYKTSSGSTYTHKQEITNENKHYFSILNFSGGYTHQLNKVFSISAEPYLEIPLTGIGEGKVNLSSGGVLFTLGVKPFKK